MGAAMGCLASGVFQCGSAIACACCTSLLNFTLSQASRFGHMLVILLTFTLAIVLGTSYPEKLNGYDYYTKINLTGGCAVDYQDNCIYRQLIYRASLSLFVLFSFLALGSYGSDMLNRSFWMMKFGLAIGIFCAFWWVDNSTFSNWAEFARVVSFGWLLVQGLLLIDFSHDAHDLLMNNSEYNSEDRSPFAIYLSSSVVAFGAAVVGLVFLFLDYAGCDMGMFFTILTLIMGVFTTIVSLLESVGRGLLTPCIMFAYSVFLCWYALLSNPHDSCNPTANNIGGAQTGAIIVVGVISIIIMLYCVINGTKILNIFNPNGEGVMVSYSDMSATKKPSVSEQQQQQQLNNVLTGESGTAGEAVTSQPSAPNTSASENTDIVVNSGTPQERAFFHVLLMLVACYGAMILTNWGRTDGAPASYNGDHVSSNESMWLKIVSQWVFLILYCRVLQVAYENNL